MQASFCVSLKHVSPQILDRQIPVRYHRASAMPALQFYHDLVILFTSHYIRKGEFIQMPAELFKENYIIMRGEQPAAELSTTGLCRMISEIDLPYDLYLEELSDDDIELRLQNLDNFYHWCASRVLTLDRVYAKEILNSIGQPQAMTDRDRAGIALSYHCLSLTDIFWVKRSSEAITFKELNLYDNHLQTAFIDVSLRGKQMTINNTHLIADDLSTTGLFPKAWIRKEDGFRLYKDGSPTAVQNELLASRICRCFRVNQVIYEEQIYDGQAVSESRLITSPDFSLVTWEAFSIYAINHDINAGEYLLDLDAYSYYMMNILDYLTGNTDRHWANWGFLIDNKMNRPIRLYDLMDFNHTFEAYKGLDGAPCLPERNVFNLNLSQREAAEKAVRKIGLNQIAEVKEEWFRDNSIRELFFERLSLLHNNGVVN